MRIARADLPDILDSAEHAPALAEPRPEPRGSAGPAAGRERRPARGRRRRPGRAGRGPTISDRWADLVSVWTGTGAAVTRAEADGEPSARKATAVPPALAGRGAAAAAARAALTGARRRLRDRHRARARPRPRVFARRPRTLRQMLDGQAARTPDLPFLISPRPAVDLPRGPGGHRRHRRAAEPSGTASTAGDRVAIVAANHAEYAHPHVGHGHPRRDRHQPERLVDGARAGVRHRPDHAARSSPATSGGWPGCRRHRARRGARAAADRAAAPKRGSSPAQVLPAPAGHHRGLARRSSCSPAAPPGAPRARPCRTATSSTSRWSTASPPRSGRRPRLAPRLARPPAPAAAAPSCPARCSTSRA